MPEVIPYIAFGAYPENVESITFNEKIVRIIKQEIDSSLKTSSLECFLYIEDIKGMDKKNHITGNKADLINTKSLASIVKIP